MSTSLMEIFRFSDLPEDLCRLVLELVAELDPETGRSCALVSRKVNAWIEPVLFHTLIIQSASQLESLRRIVEDANHGNSSSTKSPDFFANHVKVVAIITLNSDAANILSVLKACRNVEILVLWSNPNKLDMGAASPSGILGKELRDLRDFMTSPELSPRRISMFHHILSTDEAHFSHPIFQNVTHLELVRVDSKAGWDTLQSLPCLTHVSAHCLSGMEGYGRWTREAMDLFPASLRVFIVWFYPDFCFENTHAEFEGVKAIQDGDIDSRVVVAYMGSSLLSSWDLYPILRLYEDIIGDWMGYSVGKDFWTLAEEFIEERRRRREMQKGSSAA
ncbi:hypothetical protein EST38_g8252 [Candolleomyces aberdarensis]|uniref:F-box domain-containing protein n=1 Tax=Candolleomyces aberdarensis TaxID=2316362 RepID=A0A4Q2DF42_9AGAR|nr:hypothetical protein EST38_g8252 [Candolleomyces aberdarensis]